MIKFKQYIEEAFDKPYPFQLKRRGHDYITNVKLPDDTELEVFFSGMEHLDDDSETQWEIMFTRTLGPYRGTTSDRTGQGDQMRVFATVIAAIKEFIKKENPKYMDFSAAKENQTLARKDKTVLQSREKLYARFVKKYFRKDYDIEQTTSRSGTVWYLERKK